MNSASATMISRTAAFRGGAPGLSRAPRRGSIRPANDPARRIKPRVVTTSLHPLSQLLPDADSRVDPGRLLRLGGWLAASIIVAKLGSALIQGCVFIGILLDHLSGS